MSEPKKQLSNIQLANRAIEEHCKMKDICSNCGKRIKTLIFQGSGICSDDCRKDRDGDHEPFGSKVRNP